MTNIEINKASIKTAIIGLNAKERVRNTA